MQEDHGNLSMFCIVALPAKIAMYARSLAPGGANMHDQLYQVALCGIASKSILKRHVNGRFGLPNNQSLVETLCHLRGSSRKIGSYSTDHLGVRSSVFLEPLCVGRS